jgi:hypothetical protein
MIVVSRELVSESIGEPGEGANNPGAELDRGVPDG